MSTFTAVVVDSSYLGGSAFFTREAKAIEALEGTLRFEDLKTDDAIAAVAPQADILLCCGNPPITRKVLAALRGNLVIRYGIGVNSVDLEAATELGKLVCNSPGFCKEELVMHASGLILACLRNIGYYNNEVHQGRWPKGKGPEPRRLSNLTVGLFGFGDSARPMADVFAQGFHSRVIAYDPFMDAKAAAELGVEPVDFDGLLAQSDVISLHAPLNDATRHIFDATAFAKMKPTAIIANVSRGGLICEADLIAALQAGQIAGAGLDVLETEPVLPKNPLLSMPNVVLTPHSGFYGKEAVENNHLIITELLQSYRTGAIKRRNVANPGVLNGLRGYSVV